MPDHSLPEDEAALYVLGELTGAELRKFEERLARSPELSALVRELADGAVALSTASPVRKPPREVWTRIERVVSGEAGRKTAVPSFWSVWWRHGWAAATACLAGWLLYAFWINHATRPVNPSSAPDAPEAGPRQEAIVAEPLRNEAEKAATQPAEGTKTSTQPLRARPRETNNLRLQLAQLTNRITHLSQALTQQQQLLTEPDRLKFFQLDSGTGGTTGAPSAPLSPGLQRALFLAMARELGWLPPVISPSASETAHTQQQQQNNSSTATPTNHFGVDFVDLRPGSNTMASTSVPLADAATAQDRQNTTASAAVTSPGAFEPPSSTNIAAHPVTPLPGESETTGTTDASSLAASFSASGLATNAAVPGFITGTDAVLAFDSSVVPVGSTLTFWSNQSFGQYESLGTTILGNSPLVVTVPFTTRLFEGGNITVTAGTPSSPPGVVTFIGQFATPATSP